MFSPLRLFCYKILYTLPTPTVTNFSHDMWVTHFGSSNPKERWESRWWYLDTRWDGDADGAAIWWHHGAVFLCNLYSWQRGLRGGNKYEKFTHIFPHHVKSELVAFASSEWKQFVSWWCCGLFFKLEMLWIVVWLFCFSSKFQVWLNHWNFYLELIKVLKNLTLSSHPNWTKIRCTRSRIQAMISLKHFRNKTPQDGFKSLTPSKIPRRSTCSSSLQPPLKRECFQWNKFYHQIFALPSPTSSFRF